MASYLLFYNDKQNLAINASSIIEMIGAKEIVPLKTRTDIEGVVNHRDRIVPILCYPKSHKPKKGIFLILQNTKGQVGLWIDNVDTIVDEAGHMNTVNIDGKNESILKVKEKLFYVVDVENFPSHDEKVVRAA